jgi:hypothetical protein
MKVQFFIAAFCLVGLAMLAEGVGSAKEKKTLPKGKSVITPSPKVPVTKVPSVLKPKNPVQTEKFVKELKDSSGSWKTDAGQKAALGKLLANEPMTDQERQQMTDLLFNAQQAGLTKEDETALSYLLLDDAASHAGSTSPGSSSEENAGPLFLRVYNNTGERLKVWVRVVDPKKADPTLKEKEVVKKIDTLAYDLETGKAYDLQQHGQRLKAVAVHVWAISSTRSWAQHRDQELHLTTPANKSKTYTLTFSK